MTDSSSNKIEIRSPDGKYWSTIELGDDGIVFLKTVGYQDLEYCVQVRDALLSVYEAKGDRYCLCFDITEFDDVAPEGRQIMSTALLGKDSPLEKFGLFGGSFFMRRFFNLYGKISKVPMRVFKTKEETLAWLGKGGR